MFSLKNSEKKAEMEKVLKSLGIDTKKAFRCLNPEHEDKHPSMRYDAKRGKVHCFSCGVDYDIYDVKKLVEGRNVRLEDKDLTSLSLLQAKFKTGQIIGAVNFHKNKII